MHLGRLGSWLHALIFRRAHRRLVDAELRFHLEEQVAAHIAAGVPRADAERMARAAFGAVDAIRAECREARGTRFIDTTLQDLRYGGRTLRASPGFALTSILTLAFTVGAISTILTLIHTFHFQRWPVVEPDRVVEVQITRRQGSETGLASWSDYVHFRDASRTLDTLAAAYTTAPLHITTPDDVYDLNGAVVSASFFPMLGLDPAHGRFFRADEDVVPGRDRVAVIGHDFWRRRYGADPGVLGSTLVINGTRVQIIGVAPARFSGFEGRPVHVYLPTMLLGVGYRWCDVLREDDCTILRMYGRLASGASLDNARAETRTLHPPRWGRGGPGDNSGSDVRTVRGNGYGDADRRFMRLLMFVGVVLFLVCCANLAGLMISRGRARAPELAIRASLGASKGRLVRQLATEAGLLAGAGAVAGIVVSVALTNLLRARFYALDGSGRELAYDFGLRPATVVATAAIAAMAGLLFGLLPARRLLSRTTLAGRAVARTRVTATGQRGLLGLQAASAAALVALAGLLSMSAAGRARDANLAPSEVALVRVRPQLIGYPPERAQVYLRSVIERLESLPGIRSASLVGTGVALLGLSAEVATDEASAATAAGYIEIGPRYFETLGTSVLRGREFTAADDSNAAPVAVLGETLARGLWPERDPLGATVYLNGRARTVVGVTADVQLQARGEPPRPYVFVPFWQNPAQVDARLQARVAGDADAMLATIVREVRSIDPAVPVNETITLDWRLAGMFRAIRLSAAAVTYAGGLAVLLSAMGLYASLSAAVARRTREIGVRQAVGASPQSILGMITRDGLRVILVGVGAGMGLAMAASRLLRHLLYGAAAGDLVYYVTAGLSVTAVGVGACLVPALRGARIDPIRALRAD